MQNIGASCLCPGLCKWMGKGCLASLCIHLHEPVGPPTDMFQEEGTGYEVPRKSSKLEAQTQKWDFAADCLAQMSLQDKARHVRFGDTTVMAAVGRV